MVMDNGNFLKKKYYFNHFNGHYIGFTINYMAYYGRKNDIYGILGVGIKIYGMWDLYLYLLDPCTHYTNIYIKNKIQETQGAVTFYATTHSVSIPTTATTGKLTYINKKKKKTAVTGEPRTYATT